MVITNTLIYERMSPRERVMHANSLETSLGWNQSDISAMWQLCSAVVQVKSTMEAAQQYYKLQWKCEANELIKRCSFTVILNNYKAWMHHAPQHHSTMFASCASASLSYVCIMCLNTTQLCLHHAPQHHSTMFASCASTPLNYVCIMRLNTTQLCLHHAPQHHSTMFLYTCFIAHETSTTILSKPFIAPETSTTTLSKPFSHQRVKQLQLSGWTCQSLKSTT